jgi:hypothetical protein
MIKSKGGINNLTKQAIKVFISCGLLIGVMSYKVMGMMVMDDDV